MDKFGYICQQMIRDFRAFEVEIAFAFNSSFDEKVFDFNCDWFKCNNPFDTIPVRDIRGFVHNFIVNSEYKDFCDKNGYYTESGNYSTTAETVFRYITNNPDFDEAHTALNDAEIEAAILIHAVALGADLTQEYKVFRSVERSQEKTLHIRTVDDDDYYFDYKKIRINRGKTEIILK